MPTKPGRPQLHPDAARIRRLALVATDDEWETLLAALPVDSRERALYILNAVTGVTTQEDSNSG
jgi:hypothetical protein